jgi:hypothetical protein
MARRADRPRTAGPAASLTVLRQERAMDGRSLAQDGVAATSVPSALELGAQAVEVGRHRRPVLGQADLDHGASVPRVN